MRKGRGLIEGAGSVSDKLAFNILVVGHTGVGKTALVNQFVQHFFSEEHDPTVEDHHRKRIALDDRFLMLEILDTAGDHQFSHLRENHYASTEGIIIVFSVISKQSFIEAMQLYHRIRHVRNDAVPVVLFANKCDLEHQRQVNRQEVLNLIGRISYKHLYYLEGSAKDDLSVRDAFHNIVRRIQQEDISEPSDTKKKRIRATSEACSLM